MILYGLYLSFYALFGIVLFGLFVICDVLSVFRGFTTSEWVGLGYITDVSSPQSLRRRLTPVVAVCHVLPLVSWWPSYILIMSYQLNLASTCTRPTALQGIPVWYE